MDGNFHLHKMGKNCNKNDHSIWRGCSCLNKRELIEKHLEEHGSDLSEVKYIPILPRISSRLTLAAEKYMCKIQSGGEPERLETTRERSHRVIHHTV